MNQAVKFFVLAATAAIGMNSITAPAYACSEDGKSGFLPRNNMYIPTRKEVLDHNGNPVGGGITESEFNGIISAVEKIYAPIVKSRGGNLVVHRLWTDGTVNAFADREDGNWNVSMFGGLARHKETTIDGFLLVLCHELGHQIGGAPLYSRGDADEWASNEGNSDYWASAKCARRVLAKEANLRELPRLEAPDAVRVACRASFQNDNEAALCIRTSMGGLALARLLADARPESDMPFFTKTDPTKVTSTEDGHPEAQCRLDTYYQGSLCGVGYKLDTDMKDPTINTCSQEKGETVGVRPRCWYAPKSDNTTTGNPAPRGPARGRYY